MSLASVKLVPIYWSILWLRCSLTLHWEQGSPPLFPPQTFVHLYYFLKWLFSSSWIISLRIEGKHWRLWILVYGMVMANTHWMQRTRQSTTKWSLRNTVTSDVSNLVTQTSRMMVPGAQEDHNVYKGRGPCSRMITKGDCINRSIAAHTSSMGPSMNSVLLACNYSLRTVHI